MMNGFDCYRKFVALKQHFHTDTYDYFKYRGQFKLKTGSFEDRSDHLLFNKVAKIYNTEEEIVDFFVANLLWRYGDFWIFDALTEDARQIYLNYIKVKQAAKHEFGNDLRILRDHCVANKISNYLFVPENKYPELLNLLQQNVVRLETVHALNLLKPFYSYWKKKIADQILWPDIYRKLLKYIPFSVTIDRSAYIKEYNKIMAA